MIALSRANGLDRDLSARLNPWVRDKYHELWLHAQITRGEE